MITANLARTEERRKRLQDYLSAHVLRDGVFICQSHNLCRESCKATHFFEGQMPHLGHCYDLEVDGAERRIVIVGQEYGSANRGFTLDQRTDAISNTRKWPFRDRNPHMRGTTSLLRLLLGRELGDDQEGEALPVDETSTIFDSFAQVNALMCSAIDSYTEGGFSAPGRASQMMYKQCVEHLKAMLAILEPTIVVAQGSSHVAWWLSTAMGVTRRLGHQSVMLNGQPVEFFTFAHPSAPRYGFWGQSPRSRYLLNTIAPTIRTHIKPAQAGS